MEKEPTTKMYELYAGRHYSSEKFKYSLRDIQFENIIEGIHDDDLRMAILNPDELKSKVDEEREALLNDLACLEIISGDNKDVNSSLKSN